MDQHKTSYHQPHNDARVSFRDGCECDSNGVRERSSEGGSFGIVEPVGCGVDGGDTNHGATHSPRYVNAGRQLFPCRGVGIRREERFRPSDTNGVRGIVGVGGCRRFPDRDSDREQDTIHCSKSRLVEPRRAGHSVRLPRLVAGRVVRDVRSSGELAVVRGGVVAECGQCSGGTLQKLKHRAWVSSWRNPIRIDDGSADLSVPKSTWDIPLRPYRKMRANRAKLSVKKKRFKRLATNEGTQQSGDHLRKLRQGEISSQEKQNAMPLAWSARENTKSYGLPEVITHLLSAKQVTT